MDKSTVATGRRRVIKPRHGFTMLELVVAAALTLLMTALVVQVFGFVSDGVFNSRANINMSEQLRNAKQRLIQDLRGITAPTVPPLDPWSELGYFEYVEGPQVATEGTGESGASYTMTVAGDRDDILMFTTAGLEEDFAVKGGGTAGKGRFAEIAWFLRSNSSALSGGGVMQHVGTLHRRAFLVSNQQYGSSYSAADQSLRQVDGLFEQNAGAPYPSGASGGGRTPRVTTNSLGDVTMRERRSLHQPYIWPYEMMYMQSGNVTGIPAATAIKSGVAWPTSPGSSPPALSLPWMATYDGPTADAQSTSVGGVAGVYQSQAGTAGIPHPFIAPSGNSSRESDDVILTNVLGFDVKAWDPGAPVFRATAVGGNGSLGLLVPGDPGYNFGSNVAAGQRGGMLEQFINRQFNSPEFEPVAFGAYADLNYMWMWGVTTTTNEKRRDSYLRALGDSKGSYEAKLQSVNGNREKLPRPAFGYATRGRWLSGFPTDLDPKNPQKTMPWYTALPAVYDTWSRHYEFDGINNDDDNDDGIVDPTLTIKNSDMASRFYGMTDFADEGTNGIDDNGNGFIDEPPVPIDLPATPAGGGIDGIIDTYELWQAELNAERDAPPPYDAPLRAIKVTIRVFEQDSKQIREISIVHEFVPL